jgi:asparagine synthase (glutamine-hydrolysing)
MLAGFDRWGIAATLERVNGMFAIAAWDRQARVLHLARDRMGEKPLYYGRVGDRMAFGSELKALRALQGFAAPIDREAVELFLRFGYVPAPRSIYEGIRKLPPGRRAEIRVEHGGFRVEELVYWDLDRVAMEGLADEMPADEPRALDELDRRLARSVRLRMVSDVDVGAFLSGGVDSSIVTALMQRASGSTPVRTFTIGFEDRAFDEAPFAREVARHLGTDHTEVYVTGREALDVVPRLHDLYDEPFADSSQIPTHLVSGIARRRVTVALSGDGGDELFSGYERYVRGSKLARAAARMPAPLRRAAANVIEAVPPAAYDVTFGALQAAIPARLRFARPAEKFRKLAAGLREDDPRALYLGLMSFWRDGVPVAATRGAPAPHDRLAASFPDLALERWMPLIDQHTYLPDDILAKVDRAAMAVSLETRVPFLDHDLVAFAWRVPTALKLRDGRGKHLLRELLCRYVPRALVDRPKRGFAVPLAQWLRGPLRDWGESLLDTARLRQEGYLDADAVRARWRDFQAGARHYESDLWNVLMFQAWLSGTHAG